MSDELCNVRIVASFLPRDIVCVRKKHEIGAHLTYDNKPFLVTDRPKPPPLPTRSVRVVRRKVEPKRKIRVKRRK